MNNCDKATKLLLSLSKEELATVIYHSSIGKTIILKPDNDVEVILEPYTFYFSYTPKKIDGLVIAIKKR